jgi:hypothetical protein
VAIPQIDIDITTGRITLGGTDAQELLERLYAARPEARGRSLHLGDALLGAIPVFINACRRPYVFQVAVTPPPSLDFWQSDKRAGEICGEIQKLYQAAPKPFWPKPAWGSVTLLSEWRDGGWGAYFDIAQRT